MKNTFAIVAAITVGWTLANAQSTDPCANRTSNRETRQCYSTEQVRLNAEAEALLSEIVTSLREGAKGSSQGAAVNHALQEAASTLVDSQQGWKRYRDQNCKAVELSWTSGSGAGTAYEACMFTLAQQRIQSLRNDFDAYLRQTNTKIAK